MTYYLNAAAELNVTAELVKYLTIEASEDTEAVRETIKTEAFKKASRALLLETGLCFTGLFDMYAPDFYEMYATD
jgi:hypothetical protein